jgi:hypothetical protein
MAISNTSETPHWRRFGARHRSHFHVCLIHLQNLLLCQEASCETCRAWVLSRVNKASTAFNSIETVCVNFHVDCLQIDRSTTGHRSEAQEAEPELLSQGGERKDSSVCDTVAAPAVHIDMLEQIIRSRKQRRIQFARFKSQQI